ncbi:hypothetical protein C9J48_01570 [Photobacterium profundum]|jgi:hypothetical protein|uniref:NlpC/P60 domain-containing protein n=1 Tax=Photobacterium profundum 3TCK TaxID=314280 RepID=Q1Z5D1_9GAMM|nr:hypothetical protein [Photobacterium profundum]EAS43635.1 hypothetical protein P3TCK_17687 [Photobacterium profundum 3TCK]PSV64179.1 hypothetical protein C9J48_01570 [Photobacterium profundum]
MHWSEKYIGRNFDPLTYDCLDLAVDVARDELKLKIISPEHADRPIENQEQGAAINTMKHDFAIRVDEPIEGHPVILYDRGVPSHIGVATFVNGQWQCLHNLTGMGVVMERMSRMRIDAHGGVEGFYKWLS